MAKTIYNVIIEYKFPSFNEYTEACRRNKYVGAKMKRKIEHDISWFIERLPVIKKPVFVKFEWHEPTKKRDPDNVCYAKKFILDALVRCGKLHGDSPKYVKGFTDDFCYGGEYKVYVHLEEQ